jgi:hypothetical protein
VAIITSRAPKTARILIALRLLNWLSIVNLKNSRSRPPLFNARSEPIGNISILMKRLHLQDSLFSGEEPVE